MWPCPVTLSCDTGLFSQRIPDVLIHVVPGEVLQLHSRALGQSFRDVRDRPARQTNFRL